MRTDARRETAVDRWDALMVLWVAGLTATACLALLLFDWTSDPQSTLWSLLN